jgi:hypothetical protein
MLASIAIYIWPIVTATLFSAIADKRRAILVTMLAAYLLLPSGFEINLPGLPGLNRRSVTTLSIVVMLFLLKGSMIRLLPRNPLGALLLIGVVVAPALTVLTNGDNVTMGGRFLIGLTLYDYVSILFPVTMNLGLFLIGLTYFRSHSDQKMVLRYIIISCLIYSIPILAEVRLSPQFHFWVYGFYPHDFVQSVRWGGFRPNVFLVHGLELAFFVFTALMSGLILWKDRGDLSDRAERVFAGRAAAYLGVVLFLCKSLASMIYATVGGIIIAFFGTRTHVRVAFALALIALLYPQLRGMGLFPTQQLTELAATIDEGRAGSLAFRFENEDRLLTRASERPLFGWGTWGRNRVYDEVTGRDLSVTDGYWVIQIGSFGWFGFLSTFGLLTLPIIQVWRHYRTLRPGVLTSGLCLMLALNVADLLPNATLTPFSWLIAGALTGYVEQTLAERANERRALRKARQIKMSLPATALDPVKAHRSTQPASLRGTS